MMNDGYEPGTQVIIWGRPETSLILLFGEGRYEGMTFINGNYWPTVRLQNGREITVHYQGVSIGKADAVAATCSRFAGDVIEWDLEAFLRGEKPSAEQRLKSAPATNGTTTNALPPPKTASDKVMYLKREIDVEESKKKLAEKVIIDCDAKIAEKKKEIEALSNSVLSELIAVDPNLLDKIAALAAERVKPYSPPPLSPAEMLRPIGGPVSTPEPEPAPAPEVDHHKLATED